MAIVIKNLNYNVEINRKKKTILNNISLEIADNSLVTITGKTGAGKSTLINHICGLTKDFSNDIYIDGLSLSNTKESLLREKVGIVFQFPEHQLFESSVYDDIAYGISNLNYSKELIDSKVEKIIKLIKINRDILTKSPFDLSDSDKRKVAIAGVLIMEPKIIVLDEPTVGLDYESKQNILTIIKDLKNTGEVTIIIVNHDIKDMLSLADKIIVMSVGNIVFNGRYEELLSIDDTNVLSSIKMPEIIVLMRNLGKICPAINDKITSIDDAKSEIIKQLEKK